MDWVLSPDLRIALWTGSVDFHYQGVGFPKESMRIVPCYGYAVVASLSTIALLVSAQADEFAHEYVESGELAHAEYSLGTTESASGVPGKWGPAVVGTGATVTWSIIGGGVSLNTAFYYARPQLDQPQVLQTYTGNSVALGSFLSFDYMGQIEAAFNAWSSVANITFQYVLDSGSPFNSSDSPAGSEPNIRIGAFPMGASSAHSSTLAIGYEPPQNGLTAAGDIHLNSNKLFEIGFAGSGSDLFQVVAHEIGHAIGLGHVSSLVTTALMNPAYREDFSGPQPDDIAGARYIYGAPLVSAVPESGTWFAGLMVTVGGLSIWLKRRR